MIRDPSDGSVREPPKSGPPRLNSLPSGESGPPVMATVGGPDTGLRQPVRTDAQERLERSREWLKNYQEKQHAARGNTSEQQEHSTDGRAGDDQREAESDLRVGDGANDGTHREG